MIENAWKPSQPLPSYLLSPVSFCFENEGLPSSHVTASSLYFIQLYLVPSCTWALSACAAGHLLEFQENSSPSSAAVYAKDMFTWSSTMQLSKKKYICDRLCQMLVDRKELQLGSKTLQKQLINLTIFQVQKKKTLIKIETFLKDSPISNMPQFPACSFVKVLSLLLLPGRILFFQPPQQKSLPSVGVCFTLRLFTTIHKTPLTMFPGV